jgi:hypothetical protein
METTSGELKNIRAENLSYSVDSALLHLVWDTLYNKDRVIVTIFEVLTVGDVPEGAVTAVSEVIGSSPGTIQHRRSRLYSDFEWRLYEERMRTDRP